MKKTLTTAVLVAALFAGLAAYPAINGWELLELKGRVKQATFWADSSARYHFDPEGLITRKETFTPVYNEDDVVMENMKSVHDFSYEKGDAGEVTLMLRSRDGEIEEATEFFYDPAGRLARSFTTTHCGLWGPPHEAPLYREAWWDTAGNKICELAYQRNQLSYLQTWEYDGRGLLIRRSAFGGLFMNLTEQDEYEYNWRHLVGKATHRSGKGLEYVEIRTYDYDNEGRVAQMWFDNGHKDYESLTQYEYAINGSEQTTYEKHFDADGKLREEETIYEKFDAQGNLLEWEGYPNPHYCDYIYYGD